MTSRTTAASVVVVAALLLSACVLKDRHRYVQAQAHCFEPQSDPVPGLPGERRRFASIDCPSVSYKMGFIEFDEDGSQMDPAQADKVVKLIENEKARATGGKIIALVYVHGWKNNADRTPPGAKPKDVEKFTMALAELGFQARQAAGDRAVPVVGVYIGWKGRTLKGPDMFTWLSYWGRRNTANRIGGPELAAVLNRIIDTSVAGAADRSRVMLVGHSFGARVLERAIESGVTLYDPDAGRDEAAVRPRVDLVLYVNAAQDARLSMARVQALQQNPITVRHPDYAPARCPSADVHDPICRVYPLIVAISSRGDKATKLLQPIANTIRFDGGSAPVPPLPDGSFLDENPSAGRLKRSSAGHLRFLHSHDVEEVACPAGPGDPFACAEDDPTCAFVFRGRGECTACFRARERTGPATSPPFNRTAFWIMDLDARVIRDHGDIWNLSTLSLLGELMAPRGFFEPDTRRMQIRGDVDN
jgi:hypothetical protein